MIGRKAVLALFLSVMSSLASLSAQALTLRVAANVPVNSPWDLGLRHMAVEFDRQSQGRVKLVFPPSAHVASESDIIQKMQLGFDGALLTSYGLAQLYPDSFALSLPGFIGDDREFDAVLAAVGPLIRSKLEGRYVVLALSKGGWIRYFSRSPILYPSDLAGQRISVDQSSEKLKSLIQSTGAKTITGSTADFLIRINSNAVDAVFQNPIIVAILWSQLRGKINYLSPFKVSPFLGAMVFNKASWERVPPELRPPLAALVTQTAARISIDTAKLEEEAVASLDGIKKPPAPADAAQKWADLTAGWRSGPVTQMFSADILERMDAALAESRRSRK